ncbi:Mycolic acid cyclopropane synthetase-domain-containing protein [Tuber borchii]|uniref:Mycolic acid cyclopropane synthetase-domain-containing protein n=1 Tax=Tuber borchii TaxID=42251 RepID=A0A2T6ZXI3_TUBBO|nr:Mycolic acid cyclopropane synthetase-domain-containing protein [Tuber borchii]
MNTFTTAFDYAWKISRGITWEQLVWLSMRAVLGLLGMIEDGRMVITLMDGRRAPQVELMVLKMFWVRLTLFSDMGFSEAYMVREVDCTISSTLTSPLKSLLRSTNNLQNSLLNVSAHYDMSNEMFAAFLSPDMTYSCAIFPPSPVDAPATTTGGLEAAQYTKLRRLIASARIKSTDRILEIGTGWGSFAMEAVAQTGFRERKALAEKRIAAVGMVDKINVLLCDYRAFPAPRKKFDKIGSIEMLEAVGGEYLEKYFEVVDCMLKDDGGISVFQCITMPKGRPESQTRGNDFIRKYIFPGGYLPSNSQPMNAVNKGSSGNLAFDSRENFLRTFHDRIAPSLRKEYPGMNEEDVQVFNRKWEYYFAYCEARFRAKILNDIIFTRAREGAMELYEGIPL